MSELSSGTISRERARIRCDGRGPWPVAASRAKWSEVPEESSLASRVVEPIRGAA